MQPAAPEVAPPPKRRRSSLILVLAVVAVLVLAGVAYFLFFGRTVPSLPSAVLLSGRVLNAATAAAIAGAKLVISAGPGAIPYNATSNATGGYSVSIPADHNYTVTANATGYRNATTSVSVGTAPATANLALQPLVPPPPLRLGAILSLTGALSLFGTDNSLAVSMAVNEINSMGGVFGQNIQLTILDDQTNPSTAAADANQLITQDHVDAIVGPEASGMCLATLPQAAAAHVFEISGSCTSPVFTNESVSLGWFARTVPSDALQASVAAYDAYHNRSVRDAAVIGVNNVYGEATAAAFASNFTALGGTITPGSPRIVTMGSTSFASDLQAVLNVNPAPRLLYIIAYPPDGVQIVKDWWNSFTYYPSWKNVSLMFTDGCYDSSFVNGLVSYGINVTLLTGTAPAPYAGEEPSGYAAWALRFQGKYGHTPILFDANYYDAVYLAALAAQAGAAASGAAIQANLRAVANPPGTMVNQGEWAKALQLLRAGTALNYEGASGQLDVDTHGDPRGAYVIWRADANGSLTTIANFSEAFVYGLDPVAPATVFVPTTWFVAATSVETRP